MINLQATGKAKTKQSKLLNNLDKQVAEITLSAKKSICPWVQKSEWSSVIHDQATLCKFWAAVTKGVRNKINTDV
jgi:hypothetical protein